MEAPSTRTPMRLAGDWCARHGQASAVLILALIVVLVLVLVAYRGVGRLGPLHAAPAAAATEDEIATLIQRIEQT